MILHLDMDAFFASVEQLDNPSLKGKCVVVGGSSNRSVVAAASYEARAFGVFSAMPIFMARQKCRDLVILPVRRHRYSEISQKVMNILGRYTPVVEKVSIDEAYLDVFGLGRLHGKPVEIAKKLKEVIFEEVSLTCSVGVAPNKFLAKIASDMRKPDGLYVLPREDVPEFIKNLSILKVPGVGKKTAIKLNKMGCRTLADVQRYSLEQLKNQLGKYGERLFLLARGEDPSPVTTDSLCKSVSSEETLREDTLDMTYLQKQLLSHAFDVASHLRRKGVKAKTIGIKVKYFDFSQIIRSKSMDVPTHSSKEIYDMALSLLFCLNPQKKIRLIGVSASGLDNDLCLKQLSLFGEKKEMDSKWNRVDNALDKIGKKFGKGMVLPAILKKNISGD